MASFSSGADREDDRGDDEGSPAILDIMNDRDTDEPESDDPSQTFEERIKGQIDFCIKITPCDDIIKN